jgi:outer membrane protein
MKKYNLIERRILLSILLLILIKPTFSQDTLSLEETFSIAMKENLDIKISANYKDQASNQSNMGNAGLLPKINILGSGSYNEGKSSLDFATNDFTNIKDLSSVTSNINGAIEISYNVFNGLGSFYTYKKLNKQNDLKSIELRIQIEQTLIKSAKNYYNIAFLQEQYSIHLRLVEISLERYKRIKIQNEFGNASHLDVLSAEIDLNSDSINLINTTIELNNSKNILNQILNRKIDTDFIVNQKVNINKDLNYIDLQEQVRINNNNILLQQNKLELVETNKKINRSSLMPRINLSGQYGYNNMQSNTSLITDQTNLGTTGYINLSWNIFDGLSKNTMLQNAKIDIESNKLQLDGVKNEINKDLSNTFNQYTNNLNLMEIERRNQITAEKFFTRAEEQFYQGQLSRNDFRIAQVDLGRSKNRLNRSNYITKIAELNLYRLSAQIIQINSKK